MPGPGIGSRPEFFAAGGSTSRCGGSRRGAASEETFHAQVFIDVRPMDAVAGTCNLQVGPLGGGCLQEPRKPGEWHRKNPPIRQVHGQRSLVAHGPHDSLTRIRHGKPPTVRESRKLGLLSTAHYREARRAGIRGYRRQRPDTTRICTWHDRDRHGHAEALWSRVSKNTRDMAQIAGWSACGHFPTTGPTGRGTKEYTPVHNFQAPAVKRPELMQAPGRCRGALQPRVSRRGHGRRGSGKP